MESTKTKIDLYYGALIENPGRACKIFNKILEEDEKKMEKNKVEENGTEKI